MSWISEQGGTPREALSLLQNMPARLGAAWAKGYVEGCRTATMSPQRPNQEDWHGKAMTT